METKMGFMCTSSAIEFGVLMHFSISQKSDFFNQKKKKKKKKKKIIKNKLIQKIFIKKEFLIKKLSKK
jgi:hypothetical protein